MDNRPPGIPEPTGALDAVDAFVAARVLPEHREIVALLRDAMRDAVPTSCEEMRYGLPMWRGRGHLAYLSPSRRGITFGFPYGAAFADPHGALRGAAKHARHLVYRRVEDVDLDVLRACIAEAVAHDAAT